MNDKTNKPIITKSTLKYIPDNELMWPSKENTPEMYSYLNPDKKRYKMTDTDGRLICYFNSVMDLLTVHELVGVYKIELLRRKITEDSLEKDDILLENKVNECTNIYRSKFCYMYASCVLNPDMTITRDYKENSKLFVEYNHDN